MPERPGASHEVSRSPGKKAVVAFFFSVLLLLPAHPSLAATISGLQVPYDTIRPNDAVVRWTTEVATDSMVFYAEDASSSWAWTGTNTLTTSHEVPLSGLAQHTTYQYYVRATDGSTNTSTSEVLTFTTTAAPSFVISISGITTPPETLTATQAVVRWTTDVPTNSIIFYAPNGTNSWSWQGTDTLSTTHAVTLPDLSPLTAYSFYVSARSENGTVQKSNTLSFTTTTPPPPSPPPPPPPTPTPPAAPVPPPSSPPSPADVGGLDQFVQAEKQLVRTVDQELTRKLAGRILLQVQSHGEAWYVDKRTEKKFYLKDGPAAYQALRAFGLGVTNANLAKIPIGVDSRTAPTDSDRDGLGDQLEQAIGTDPNNPDTDDDTVADGEEISRGDNPSGAGRLTTDTTLVAKLRGTILLQVQSHGEAWYLNPVDGKRYYMKDGDAAYQIMRFLSLGVTNANLHKIQVGDLQ